MTRALLSVANKDGITEIAQALYKAGVELVSTGGTFDAIKGANLPVTPVDQVTGFPEMLDGRVKTLHPAIHAGLLFRRSRDDDARQIAAHGFQSIDVVVCNLYPFEQAIASPDHTFQDAIENIDIGGPTLIRAAAKNHEDVVVIVDPEDYASIGSLIGEGGTSAIDGRQRRELAAKAFDHTAAYDALIAGYLGDNPFPDALTVSGRRMSDLRYGENPHQKAAAYRFPGNAGLHGIGGWSVLSGGELSYNNFLDATAGWTAVHEFSNTTAVIVKHNVPCGVATDSDIVAAFERALAGDPVSAFGGVIVLNRAVTSELAEVIAQRKYDVILAPGYHDNALDRLRRRKGLRILDTTAAIGPASVEYRLIPGGLLAQTADLASPDVSNWETVTERQPTDEEIAELAFAWSVVKHVKSNAIVLSRERGTVGICGGQPNRVDSVRMAVQRAGDRARGSVLASDAFFPFADGVEEAVRAGVTAIAQPGGSTRDAETIAAANEAGAAMVFTRIRHFRH